jgi:hypothetical protein
MKSEYDDVGPIRDPDLVTELLQHAAASSWSVVICFANGGSHKSHGIGKGGRKNLVLWNAGLFG